MGDVMLYVGVCAGYSWTVVHMIHVWTGVWCIKRRQLSWSKWVV